MLCTALLVDRFSSSLEYIPCWATILSSFMESVVTDTARIVPIGNHISVFIPPSEAERKTQFMDATMQTSLGMELSTSIIARQLRDMADRFEYYCMEEEQRSTCTPAPSSSQSQVRVHCIICPSRKNMTQLDKSLLDFVQTNQISCNVTKSKITAKSLAQTVKNRQLTHFSAQ
uniref:Uncharacterized protein n=1 Tax=Elaeophora elaphi TaxID=1147741 RepID=A0A0R3RNB4_9BILA